MVFPPILIKWYSALEKVMKSRGFIAGKSGRHMKFPYTLSAKIAQFPMFYYMKKNWIWMYYPMGWVVAFYFIKKIDDMARSEANYKSWAETQRKFAEKEHEH